MCHADDGCGVVAGDWMERDKEIQRCLIIFGLGQILTLSKCLSEPGGHGHHDEDKSCAASPMGG